MQRNFFLAVVSAIVSGQNLDLINAQLGKANSKYLSYMAGFNKSYNDLATLNKHFVQWQIADATINELNLQAA